MTIKVHMIRAQDDNDVIDQVMWVVCEGGLTEHAQLVSLHGFTWLARHMPYFLIKFPLCVSLRGQAGRLPLLAELKLQLI